MLDICEDLQEYLFFCNAKIDILVIVVGAIMDDTVHIQVQIIWADGRKRSANVQLADRSIVKKYLLTKFWYPIFLDQLGYERIPLGEPPESLWDPGMGISAQSIIRDYDMEVSSHPIASY